MADRFTRLYKLQNDLCAVGSPLAIEAGVLLKDEQTNNIIAQLKFHSISDKTIKAVWVKLAAFDVSGNILQGVDNYQFLDLHINNGNIFGGNRAIIMPSAVTRSFAITGLSVFFTDDTSWTLNSPEDLKAIPSPKPLTQALGNDAIAKQYSREINESAIYAPQLYTSFWRCPCGNLNSGDKCTKCQAGKQKVLSAYNLPQLKEHLRRYIEAEATKRESARLEQIEQARKRKMLLKRLKIITFIILLIATIAIVSIRWLIPDIIKPSLSFAKAEQLLESGQRDEAISVLSTLGDFRNADKLIQDLVNAESEKKYTEAVALFEHGEYRKAIKAFQQIETYKDSATFVKKAKDSLMHTYSDYAFLELVESTFSSLFISYDIDKVGEVSTAFDKFTDLRGKDFYDNNLRDLSIIYRRGLYQQLEALKLDLHDTTADLLWSDGLSKRFEVLKELYTKYSSYMSSTDTYEMLNEKYYAFHADIRKIQIIDLSFRSFIEQEEYVYTIQPNTYAIEYYNDSGYSFNLTLFSTFYDSNDNIVYQSEESFYDICPWENRQLIFSCFTEWDTVSFNWRITISDTPTPPKSSTDSTTASGSITTWRWG